MSENAMNSLQRVVSVLDLFSEHKLDWSLDEMMSELGYSRPTLYRYLKTLKEAGLIASLPGARFTLGPKVIEMDYLVRRSDPMVVHGPKHLRDLVGRYRCTAFLVRAYGNKILCVASESSAGKRLSSYPRGRPMSLDRGAISRSIMAHYPKRQLLPVVQDKLVVFSGLGLGLTREEVMESFKGIRRQGYATAFGEVTPNAVGVASPVFDGTSKTPVGSLCLTFAREEFDSLTASIVGTEVHNSAKRITSMLTKFE